jgi:transformation/transcription domain-associated protein
MRFGRLFAQLLADPTSKPLRDVVQEDVAGLLGHSVDLKEKTDTERYVSIVNAISIIRSIAPTTGQEWMAKNKDLMGRLLAASVELRDKSKDGVIPVVHKLAVEQALASAMEVFMIYLSNCQDDLDFLFEVI